MKLAKYLHKIGTNIIKFVHIQLFITLISLPILVSWGMPISLLTFAGNFFFGPLLSVFLLFSSLIFFFEILHVPNGILIMCLEWVTDLWLKTMSWGTPHMLWALPMPPLLVAIIIPLGALAILHAKIIKHRIVAILCYGLFLTIIFAYGTWCNKQPDAITTLDCNNGAVTILHTDKQTCIIDPGVIGRRLSGPSWCEYTLLPHLAKQYGCSIIDHFIIAQPNRIIFDALTSLLEKITIKNIYLVWWEGTLPRYWWFSYRKLLEQCNRTGCKLIRIYANERTISLGKSATIQLTPLETVISKDTFTFPAICVTASLGNESVTVYSARYKKPENGKF